jgi:hypothetical protein
LKSNIKRKEYQEGIMRYSRGDVKRFAGKRRHRDGSKKYE